MPKKNSNIDNTLALLRIFINETDENQGLTKTELAERLAEFQQIENVDERTITREIDKFNKKTQFEIKRYKQGKAYFYYLNKETEFSKAEAVLFINLIKDSKILSEEEKDDLTFKIQYTQITKVQDQLDEMLSLYVRNTDVEDTLKKLELVLDAIDNQNKITFNMLSYNADGTKKLKRDGYLYTFSPNEVIIRNGKFYLIGSFEGHGISNPRLDRMTNIEILKDLSVSFDEVCDVDLETYLEDNETMYSGKKYNVKIEVKKSEENITYLFDSFIDVKYLDETEDCYIYKVGTTDSLPNISWFLANASTTKVIGPNVYVNKIKEQLKHVMNVYL